VEESLGAHPDLKFDPENIWWKRHLKLVREAVELSQGDFMVNIPDLVESLDIVASMRGAQEMCMALFDEPEAVHKFVDQVDNLYFNYYDPMYDLVKLPDGTSSFACFNILY
jgi:5-methyltetrahydrofolate--homocysteine methyltransferase